MENRVPRHKTDDGVDYEKYPDLHDCSWGHDCWGRARLWVPEPVLQNRFFYRERDEIQKAFWSLRLADGKIAGRWLHTAMHQVSPFTPCLFYILSLRKSRKLNRMTSTQTKCMRNLTSAASILRLARPVTSLWRNLLVAEIGRCSAFVWWSSTKF